MSSTDQAQEPTMEEILASIRRIISDDTEEVAEDTETAELSDEIEVADVDFDNIDVDEIDVVEEEDDAEDDVLELTEVVEEEEEADTVDPDFDFDSLDIGEDEDEEPVEEISEEEPADIAFVDMDMDAVSGDLDEMPDFDAPEPVAAEPKKGLLSDEADATVAAAFGQLASTLLARDGTTRTLEELVQEMLRPMLKAWLDQNLPTVVEDLVRQEIERVSRRGPR